MKKRRIRASLDARKMKILLFLVLLMLVLAAVGGSFAHAVDSETSPLWWTLTDELTPDELRAMHDDVEMHQIRYQQAAKARHVTPLSEKKLKSVRQFYDGSLTPEVVPMWQALDAFALRFYGERRSSYLEKASLDLSRSGIGGESASTIVTYALRQLDETENLALRLRNEQEAFVKILRKALERLDRVVYRKAVETRDVELLARATGHDPVLVSKLMRIWERDPTAERATVNLRLLKDALNPVDWDRLRTFLLTEQAPQISLVDISNNGG